MTMKTWRERIAEARVAGHFTYDDVAAMQDFSTCMVGEASAVLGEEAWYMYPSLYNLGLSIGWGHCDGPVFALHFNKFDRAEECLERIEDEVLKIKRAL